MALEGIVTGKVPMVMEITGALVDVLRIAITFDIEELVFELENR
jgi:hypothetical protein